VAIPVGAAPWTVDLVAGQLERLPCHVQRPGLAGAGPANDERHAIPAAAHVVDHGGLVVPDGGVAVEDLADDLGAHHGAALARPLGGAVHKLPFEGQQLRRGELVDPEPAIMGDPHGPLGQEPVGGLLGLGERFLGARGDGEALGERVHHVGPGERARLGRQPVGAGQLVQDLADLVGGRRSAALTAADLGKLALAHPLLRQLPRPPHVHALLRLAVVLGRPGRHRRRAGRLDPRQALLGQPVVDLLRALAEPLDQRPIVQPDDLGGPRALIDWPPADPEALGERRPLSRQVQVIGRHQVGVEPIGVERGPAAVGAVGGVLDEDVGVELRITRAAEAVLERHRQHAGLDVAAVGAVVVAAHPDPVALQVADADLEGVMGVGAEHLAAEPLDRLDLDPLGAAQPAGRLHRAHVALECLRPRERLQVRHALLGGPLLERLQQRPSRQLGARVSAPQRRAPLLAGGGVEALEHRPHLLRAGDPFEAAGLGGAADEAARGLSAAGEVFLAVAGDLVQPVGLLARLQALTGSATLP
jgi:hypothetical protein